MKRSLSACASALLALCGLALGQPDTCRIFIWDNDAGECAQEYPATSMDDDYYCFAVWADMRDGNWNIYGRKGRFTGLAEGDNFLVNQNGGGESGGQKNPGISGVDKKGGFAVVWQDSTNSTRYRIRARIFKNDCSPVTNEILVSKSDLPAKFRPRVAMHKYSGRFVVVWTEFLDVNTSNVYARLVGPEGNMLTDTLIVNQHLGSRHHRRPSVCYSDSGIVVVWEDWRYGDYPTIWAQRFDTDLARIGGNYQVSSPYRHAYFPDVSTVSYTVDGFHAVVWEDRNTGAARDVYTRKFTWRDTLTTYLRVNPSALTTSYAPTVAVHPNQDYVVAWHDSVNGMVQSQVFARYCPRGSEPTNMLKLNVNDARNQRHPDISANDSAFTVAWHDSIRPTGRGDIFGQNIIVVDLAVDTIAKYRPNYRIDNLRSFGRTVWYRPKKNFDNPSTPWNEDPIAEPDSLYIPLDSAFVRAFAERNNVPGQQFFKITDSPMLREDYVSNWKGPINGGDYDLCVMDLGYPTDALRSGEISYAQQCSLMKFSDEGGALLCSGNDFGQMYGGTVLHDYYFAAVHDGPGNPSSIGNIDSLMGVSGTLAHGMKFHYPFQGEEDNSVDRINPGSYGGFNADAVFISEGPAKWSYCRGISYSAFWKDQKVANRRNVYLAFSMGSLISDGVYPNTQSELTRRILAYQGFNVEPAPIHDLTANAGASEGRVNLAWTAVCDDAIGEPASAYQLRYSRYNNSAPDLGMLSSEQKYIDSGMVYYRSWFAPGAPGTSQSVSLYGLPPGDTLIFALKAGDESTPARWSELGAQPRAVVAGDRVTPHSIGLGYSYGCVNDFIAPERIDVRGGDTLFCTWDAANVYFGYSRCDWRTAGDLLVYMDTRDGGADSTVDWNASGQRSAFDSGRDFLPDFCLVFDRDATAALKSWNPATSQWRDSFAVYSPALYSLDSVNACEYAEIQVPFARIGNYDTTRAFRYLAVAQQENSNASWNVFPLQNATGKGAKVPASYPYYYEVYGGLRSGIEPATVSRPLAVELSQFAAIHRNGAVELAWRTASETDSYQWLIDRSTAPDFGYQRIAAVPAQGNSPLGQDYSYIDGAVLPGLTYYYLLGDQDFGQNTTWHGPVSVTTGPNGKAAELYIDCHPNPAREGLTLRYSLPHDGVAELAIYDVSGRLVRSFGRSHMAAGRYAVRWDCTDHGGRRVASGVYLYRLAGIGNAALTGKLTVIR